MERYAMRIGDRRVWGMILSVIWVIVCGAGGALADPVQWSDGRIVDLTVDQVERIKRQPGIHYFDYQPDRIIKSRIDQWDIIELPPSLGGGFLIGRSASLNDALAPTGPIIAAEATADSEQPPPPTGTVAAINPRAPAVWQWWLATGYRYDELNWNIGVPGINVLSELEWEDLQLWQVSVGLSTLVVDRIKIETDFAYGYAFDGDVIDSDYNADDRAQLWSRSVSSAEGSTTTDFSIGAGYRFTLLGEQIGLTPMGGYSIHYQYLRIRDGFQTVSEPGLAPGGVTPAPIGPLDSDLDSTYDARWQGFWIGLESQLTILNRKKTAPLHEITINAELHDADYFAKAHWNLRDLKFEHDADGYGMVFEGGYRYFFTPSWSLLLTGSYQKWETDEGTDRVFFADGSTATTTLNEVNWESIAVMIGIDCRF